MRHHLHRWHIIKLLVIPLLMLYRAEKSIKFFGISLRKHLVQQVVSIVRVGWSGAFTPLEVPRINGNNKIPWGSGGGNNPSEQQPLFFHTLLPPTFFFYFSMLLFRDTYNSQMNIGSCRTCSLVPLDTWTVLDVSQSFKSFQPLPRVHNFCIEDEIQ